MKKKKARPSYPIKVGITGSLASGKSTTLEVFKKSGFHILSADEVVHEIYSENQMDVAALRKAAAKSPKALDQLEKFVHPLFRKKLKKFFEKHEKKNQAVAVEIPLLFEKDLQRNFDVNVFIYAPSKDREARAVRRGMTKKLFRFLESRQLSAEEKSAKADFVLLNLEKASLKKQAARLAELLLSQK